MTNPQDVRFPLVAPVRHTVIFLAIVFGVTALGAVSAGRAAADPGQGHSSRYLMLLIMEWALFYFAWRGLRLGGTPLRDVVGGRWSSWKDIALTFALAAGFWVCAAFVLGALKRGLDLMGAGRAQETARTMALILPHGALETTLWVLLSISAGFCEEVVFRGYLQRQFMALTRHQVPGIALSALVFGLGHAYQGILSVTVITAYGLLFGSLAYYSRSLRPGMIAHAWEDLSSGLFRA